MPRGFLRQRNQPPWRIACRLRVGWRGLRGKRFAVAQRPDPVRALAQPFGDPAQLLVIGACQHEPGPASPERFDRTLDHRPGTRSTARKDAIEMIDAQIVHPIGAGAFRGSTCATGRSSMTPAFPMPFAARFWTSILRARVRLVRLEVSRCADRGAEPLPRRCRRRARRSRRRAWRAQAGIRGAHLARPRRVQPDRDHGRRRPSSRCPRAFPRPVPARDPLRRLRPHTVLHPPARSRPLADGSRAPFPARVPLRPARRHRPSARPCAAGTDASTDTTDCPPAPRASACREARRPSSTRAGPSHRRCGQGPCTPKSRDPVATSRTRDRRGRRSVRRADAPRHRPEATRAAPPPALLQRQQADSAHAQDRQELAQVQRTARIARLIGPAGPDDADARARRRREQPPIAPRPRHAREDAKFRRESSRASSRSGSPTT